ncbi:MAG: hypothetical protein ACRD3K_00180 [Edaphobacter sp.]
MRSFLSLATLFAAACANAQSPAQLAATLPDAPSQALIAAENPVPQAVASSSSDPSDPFAYSFYPSGQNPQDATQTAKDSDKPQSKPNKPAALDANGNPIPLEHQQPQRILGFMPNFRSVSVGAQVHPPGWKYNFTVATHQALDYSTFIFLGLTSLTAEGLNEHPALGKGVGGFYAYTWRGFLDKTDGTYLSAWLLPSLLHEDTRFYPLGHGHSVFVREIYIISRQGVARTYGGSQTPNIAGLGGKVLTQVISRYYYPPSATDFGSLAEKFGYSVMRDVMFSNIREFYPDIATHYIRKHREKVARLAAANGNPE